MADQGGDGRDGEEFFTVGVSCQTNKLAYGVLKANRVAAAAIKKIKVTWATRRGPGRDCDDKGREPEGVEAEVAGNVVGGADAAEGDGLERGGEDDDAHEEDRAHLRRCAAAITACARCGGQ